MVQHVLLFKFFPEAVFKLGMVQHIMRHVVKEVSDNKTCKKPIEQSRGKCPLKEQIKCQRQRNACRRGHHQTFSIIRIIVMNAMKYEMNPFAPFGFGIEMEYKTVHDIFSECPDEQT